MIHWGHRGWGLLAILQVSFVGGDLILIQSRIGVIAVGPQILPSEGLPYRLL